MSRRPPSIDNEYPLSRRALIGSIALGAAATGIGVRAVAQSLPGPNPIDIGGVKDGKVDLPNSRSPADSPDAEPAAPLPIRDRVGYAVVALGRLSLEEILPAFAMSKRAKLVALVSGSPDKARLVAKQYDIEPTKVFNYQTFEGLKDLPEVQVVYVVLPNALHREYVERAARIGKHVLCEKPMATSVADAEAMISTCRTANVKLMIAYRCQYEPYNRHVADLARTSEFGALRLIEATNTQSQGDPNQWRLRKALSGGGSLPDIGLYCLNAARFITREEPNEVFARLFQPKDDPRFREVEERVAFMLRFPSGVIANCDCSYDSVDSKDYCVRFEKGFARLEGAFAYTGKKLSIGRRSGNLQGIEDLRITEKNQFALELDHMAECISENRVPRTPGEEGLQDMVIMQAIYRSAESGMSVALQPSSKLDSTRGPPLSDASE